MQSSEIDNAILCLIHFDFLVETDFKRKEKGEERNKREWKKKKKTKENKRPLYLTKRKEKKKGNET